jgi:hypothetical protein
MGFTGFAHFVRSPVSPGVIAVYENKYCNKTTVFRTSDNAYFIRFYFRRYGIDSWCFSLIYRASSNILYIVIKNLPILWKQYFIYEPKAAEILNVLSVRFVKRYCGQV